MRKRTRERPDRRVEDLVDLYLEGVPYSEETAQARREIERAARARYQAALAEGRSESQAFEALVTACPRLSDLAALGGYPPEAVERWRAEGETMTLWDVKRAFQRQRVLSWGIAALVTEVVMQLFWLLYNLFVAPLHAIASGVFACLCAVAAGALCRRFVRREQAAAQARYDAEAYDHLRLLRDRYLKRRINSLAALFTVLAALTLFELIFFFSGGSKLNEVVETVFANSILGEIPLFLFLKNALCFHFAQGRVSVRERDQTRKHLMALTLFFALYWLAAVVLALFTGGRLGGIFNVFFAAVVLFAGLVLLYNMTRRRGITYRNLTINKRRLLAFFCAVLLAFGYSYIQRDTWYTQPYINSVPVVPHNEHPISYNEETGVYTITASTEDFKILHLTDIHLGGSLYSYGRDLKALKAVYAEIEHTRPDLVVVTGDLVFPVGIISLSLNNSAPVSQFAAFMRNVGIPWAFTYGNHDTESMATLSTNDLDDLYKSLSYKTSGTLLYPYVQPGITGRNNQLIEIREPDGSLRQAIFLIDSNAYTGEGLNAYDYIHDDQVDWYEGQVKRLEGEEGGPVSSMVFFHIPLQEYRTAYELYEVGSDQVTYFFGENNEKMIDKVCCSDYPSKLFDTMVELGSTKAAFCGHDHYNNMSLEYRGVRLSYGMSIDYLAMPGIEHDEAQRGGELITLHPGGDWELEQVPLEHITR